MDLRDPDDPWKEELETCIRERWKVIDRRNAVVALERSFGEDRTHPNFDATANPLIRAGLIPLEVPPVSDAKLERKLEDFISAQQALPWPGSEEAEPDSSHSSQTSDFQMRGEDLEDQLEEARRELIANREDRTGRYAGMKVQRHATVFKDDGQRYPPSEIVDQYALIESAEALAKLNRAEKKYRKIKRKMREQELAVKKVLSDDSEFSSNIDEDGAGSGWENPAGVRRSRHWKRQLTKPDRFLNPLISGTVPESIVSDPLTTFSTRSGMTRPRQMYDSRRVKRAAMWERLQRESTRSALADRARVSKRPYRKYRILHRHLSNFQTQKPRTFRLTNGEPRPKRVKVGLDPAASSVSSHGDFHDWNKSDHSR